MNKDEEIRDLVARLKDMLDLNAELREKTNLLLDKVVELKDELKDELATFEAPVVTQQKFSEQTGLRTEQVKGQVQVGNLPSKKIGKLRMVNVALLNANCLEDA